MDVRQDAAAGDGDGAQGLRALVVADGELDVARDDARLLVRRNLVARRNVAITQGSIRMSSQIHNHHSRSPRPDISVRRESALSELAESTY